MLNIIDFFRMTASFGLIAPDSGHSFQSPVASCSSADVSQDQTDAKPLAWIRVTFSTGDPPAPRSKHSVHKLSSSQIIVFGGFGSSGFFSTQTRYNDIFLFSLGKPIISFRQQKFITNGITCKQNLKSGKSNVF